MTLADPLACSARRILLLGVTGSGKSTLAQRIEARCGIPAIDVDALAWRPGWVKTPDAKLAAAASVIAAGPSWVFDSTWSATLPAVLPRTELIVALDLPRMVSLTRLLARTARRLRTREPVCGENVETLGSVLNRDSILLWHARSFARKRAPVLSWGADTGMPPLLRLRSARETETWLGLLARGERSA